MKSLLEKIPELFSNIFGSNGSTKNKWTLLGGILLLIPIILQQCGGEIEIPNTTPTIIQKNVKELTLENVTPTFLDQMDQAGLLDEYKTETTRWRTKYLNNGIDEYPEQTYEEKYTDELGNEINIYFTFKGKFIDANLSAILKNPDSVYITLTETVTEIKEVPIVKFQPPTFETLILKDSVIAENYRAYYKIPYRGEIDEIDLLVIPIMQRLEKFNNTISIGLEVPFADTKTQHNELELFVDYNRRWKRFNLLTGVSYQPNRTFPDNEIGGVRVRAGVGYNWGKGK